MRCIEQAISYDCLCFVKQGTGWDDGVCTWVDEAFKHLRSISWHKRCGRAFYAIESTVIGATNNNNDCTVEFIRLFILLHPNVTAHVFLDRF
jgi:hypothetical protein